MSETHPIFALFAFFRGTILFSVFTFASLADVAKGGDGAKSALRLCVRFFCFELLELLDLPDSLDSFSSPFPLETVRFLP
jgi:hypothetical protein